MIESSCNMKIKCCWIRYCPLEVAFGRTIHTFQGQECGPGKYIESIIVDPGKRQFEGINPGTLNCCITRASTAGGNDISKSALFLTGSNINYFRFKNMIITKTGDKYKTVKERDMWISFIEKRIKETMKELERITEVDFTELDEKINHIHVKCYDLDNIIRYHLI